MDFQKEIRQFQTYLEEEELSSGTVEIYTRHAAEFIQYLNGRKPVTKNDAIRYKHLLKSRERSVCTLNLAIISVNRYLKYSGYPGSTVRTEKIQRRQILENIISISEYKKMLDYARRSGREKYYCIMRTLALTGIRISELQHFTVEILGQHKIDVFSKGKQREIYLPDCLIEELRNYCGSRNLTEGVIFRGNSALPITRVSVYKMFLSIAEAAGVPKEKAHPHSFRHLFAVTYMEHYGNLPELADILGHSSLETTRIYTATTAAEKRKRMNSLGL